jgi:hypothetical protein
LITYVKRVFFGLETVLQSLRKEIFGGFSLGMAEFVKQGEFIEVVHYLFDLFGLSFFGVFA